MNEDKIINVPPDVRSSLTRRPYPRNPIGVISLFVFLIDAIATVSLKFLLDAGSTSTGLVVVFLVAFPTLMLLLFFGTLWFRRESLYSPSDFREDATFMRLLAKVDARIDKVEIRQKAAQLDPRGDPSDVLALIPELLAKGDSDTVMSLVRAFLKVRRYASALEVLGTLSRTPLTRAVQAQTLAFTAYCFIGNGAYEEALPSLEELRRSEPTEAEKFWPALAFSYVNYKLDRQAEFFAWLNKASSNQRASEYLDSAIQIYPELKEHLHERLTKSLRPEHHA
ncbi:MAG: hypothetical protein ACJ76J_29320 [Thermoanaerobaculia bacterium]